MRNLPIISQSEMLPEKIRQAILSYEPIIVSGQPVWQSSPDGKELFHQDCAQVIDMPLLVTNALLRYVPTVGHRHIPDEFLGEYIVIIGDNPDTQDEYCFGLRPELNFDIEVTHQQVV